MGLLLITRFTLQEAIRRKLFLAMTILSVLLLILFTLLLNFAMQQIGDPANNPGLSSLQLQQTVILAGVAVSFPALWLVYLISGASTIFLTAGMISGEIEAGTFVIIVPKPIRRIEIILGKWLGYALILSVYTAFMALAFMEIINWITGYFPSQAGSVIGMLELSMLVLLALTTLCGAFVPTAANGAIVFMLFISAFVSSIVQFAVPQDNHAVQNTVTFINLLIPTDAIWHGASFFLIPTAILDGVGQVSPRALDTPFTSASSIAPALLLWVAVYIIVLPLLSSARFQRRDL